MSDYLKVSIAGYLIATVLASIIELFTVNRSHLCAGFNGGLIGLAYISKISRIETTN